MAKPSKKTPAPFIALVRINKRPAGEAPDHILDGWIGTEFNAVIMEDKEPEKRLGALSSKIEQGTSTVIMVPQKDALNALKKISREAWNWWRNARFPRANQVFVFNNNECEIIGDRKPLPLRRIVWDVMDPRGINENHPDNQHPADQETTRRFWETLNE